MVKTTADSISDWKQRKTRDLKINQYLSQDRLAFVPYVSTKFNQNDFSEDILSNAELCTMNVWILALSINVSDYCRVWMQIAVQPRQYLMCLQYLNPLKILQLPEYVDPSLLNELHS